jgi:hypothetical protein
MSTVTLRVVGGEEKGSLKSGEDQQHIQKTDPSSRQIGHRWGSTPRLTD